MTAYESLVALVFLLVAWSVLFAGVLCMIRERDENNPNFPSPKNQYRRVPRECD